MGPYFLIILFAVFSFCVIMLLLKVYCVKLYRRYTNSVRNSRNTRIPQTHTDYRQTSLQDRNNSHHGAYNSDACNTPTTMPFPSTRARPMQPISANNPYPPPFSHTSTNSAANNVQMSNDSDLPPSYEVATGQCTSTLH
ncbi:hypothetical protein PPYR_00644 [Photinus pyralis]|uniref:Uncharacterized protein n=1 Tax=Photinus pyralis TaxID=7054 RepID=A0A5N4B279_PHOPY|nr:uncharacterized protein LOC116172087 [Photinus pyralis]KAB0803674.1 hypothetical protein PPYR_00644 [Photinus pyralis]